LLDSRICNTHHAADAGGIDRPRVHWLESMVLTLIIRYRQFNTNKIVSAELLEAVVERANSDNVTRSALTIRALAAYLKLSSIREPYMPDIT